MWIPARNLNPLIRSNAFAPPAEQSWRLYPFIWKPFPPRSRTETLLLLIKTSLREITGFSEKITLCLQTGLLDQTAASLFCTIDSDDY